jgi:CheY-like chemotaxis protein
MTTCIRASRSAPGSTGAVSGSRSPIVAIADGGINGLAALDDSAFDRMVADILMPNMRGFESIRVFHRRVPTVPLIAISGYAFRRKMEPDRLASTEERWRAWKQISLPLRG